VENELDGGWLAVQKHPSGAALLINPYT
jgi:hypothetical protein